MRLQNKQNWSPARSIAAKCAGSHEPRSDAVRRPILFILVELSGNCPPSPKRLTRTFSRLSFDFVLDPRASRNQNFACRSSLNLGRIAERFPIPAELYDGARTVSATFRLPG